MKTPSITRKTNGIRHFTLLLAALVLICIVLSVAVISSSRRIARQDRILDSIPLRNDYRSMTAGSISGGMRQVTFFDDSTVFYITGNTLVLRCLSDSSPLLEFLGHSGDIQDYEVSPDRRRVVTSSQDGTLRLWDTHSGECLACSRQLDTLAQPASAMLHDIVLCSGGRRLMSADMEGVKTWRTSDLKLLSSEGSSLYHEGCGQLSPDRKTLCSPIPEISEGFKVFARKKGRYELLDSVKDRTPLCYSDDGRRLLVTSKVTGGMEIWDTDPKTMRSGRSLLWFNIPKASLGAAALSKDGKRLVSVHGDGTVRIWSARSGAEREVLHYDGQEMDGVCFSPNGAMVMAYNSQTGVYCLWGPFSWII